MKGLETSMNRFVTLLAAVFAFGLAACTEAGPKRKNVILITLDTVRADYVSAYGVRPGITPNLDALAAEGTRFDMAISTAGVTPVSHASILTGLNNQTHKLRVLSAPSGYTLPEDVPTLATVLAKEGYRTLAVHSAFPVSRSFGFKRGFEVFEDMNTEMRTGPDGQKTSWDVNTAQRRSDATTDVVTRVLGDEEPFFLWIHYWDPHDWAMVPPEGHLPPRDVLFDEQGQIRRPAKELYAAEITYQDEQIGRMLGELRKRGVLDDTLVVVTADHGQGLMEHDWAAHRLLYQEQVHVPLIVRVPGAASQPVVRDLVRTTDVFPTILDYLGVAAPAGVDGRSLRALMEGKPDEKRIAFGDQINGYDTNAGMTDKRPLDHWIYMAFDWPWKLIYRPAHPDKSELFNVETDPDEALNVYLSQPDVALRLRKELARAHPWVPGPFADAGAGHDAAALAALQGLGYTAGQTVDESWSWTCPEHLDQDLAKPDGRCPVCKSPALMIKR
jgi:arylsulfatase A-like enzyme